MKKRSEIDERFKWDLSDYCKSDEEYYQKLDELLKKSEKIKDFKGKLSDDDSLLEFLNFQNEIELEAKFTPYAFLRQCENGADQKASEMFEKRTIVLSKIGQEMTAVETEINSFSLEKLKKLQNDPKFSAFRRFFELEIRQKKHNLSQKEEILLSNLSEFTGGFSNNFDKFSDSDLKFDDVQDSKGKMHELNHSSYSTHMESKDRVLRQNAMKGMNGKYGQFINFLSTNYINEVKQNCVFARIRKYDSVLERELYCEEVSRKVYDMLIKKVHENVGLLHRYFELRRKKLGLKEFAIYDTSAPFDGVKEKKYSYDEAIELIKAAVAPLGEEYVSLIQRAKDERWIDVMPNVNKYSGAFQSGSYGNHPIVLVNFEGNLGSVFTLAHELGHAMHFVFCNRTQPIQTSDYATFVAEVASITNEVLLLQHLIKNSTSNDEKICLYDRFMREVNGTIFRQTMFAEFEQFAHEEYEKGNPLSAELLCDKYEKLNNFYFGKKVKQIKEMRFEWARIPHFYDGFYVYKYATSMICALEIASKILDDEKFSKKYLKFLSSGASADPISLLRIADCDIENEKTFDDAFAMCEKHLKMWENLL